MVGRASPGETGGGSWLPAFLSTLRKSRGQGRAGVQGRPGELGLPPGVLGCLADPSGHGGPALSWSRRVLERDEALSSCVEGSGLRWPLEKAVGAGLSGGVSGHWPRDFRGQEIAGKL